MPLVKGLKTGVFYKGLKTGVFNLSLPSENASWMKAQDPSLGTVNCTCHLQPSRTATSAACTPPTSAVVARRIAEICFLPTPYGYQREVTLSYPTPVITVQSQPQAIYMEPPLTFTLFQGCVYAFSTPILSNL